MRRPPKHPNRPHDSLIHAILAATFDISPLFQMAPMRAYDRSQGQGDHFCLMLGDGPMRAKDNNALFPDGSFKNFHLAKARTKVETSLITESRNPLDWILACILSTYQLWSDARITESYFLSATISRSLAPAGLDKLPHFVEEGDAAENAPGLFGVPKGIEEDERRMALWHTFIIDMITGGSMRFYENCISEQAVTANLPNKVEDYQAGRSGPPNEQTLASPDLFRVGHLDDFTLHIKSSILVRRTMTLHCRNQAGDAKHKKPAALSLIDKSISELLAAFPPTDDYSQPETLSVDRLMAHGNVQLAMIHLHEPYLSMAYPASYSNQRVQLGVRNILNVIRQLLGSHLNFALLHAQLYIVWSVAGRMLGKHLEHLNRSGAEGGEGKALNEGEREEELQSVTQSLDLIISALQRAGEKSLKAKRCYELLTYMRKGLLSESVL